jgi:hypothetical protein
LIEPGSTASPLCAECYGSGWGEQTATAALVVSPVMV